MKFNIYDEKKRHKYTHTHTHKTKSKIAAMQTIYHTHAV